MTFPTTGKLCQMCCSSAKQLASREAVPACCHILCPVKPQGQIQAAQFKKSIFEAKHICSEQKPHLRSLNMQAAYKIHAGFLQHIQEIFKDWAICCLLVLWSFWRCEQFATAFAAALPSPGSRTLSDPISHVSPKVAVLCQGTSAVFPCGKDSSSYR